MSPLNFYTNSLIRFCEFLFFGSRSIHNPAGLLQLFAHEWKRNFVDHLPSNSSHSGCGHERTRVLSLIKENFDFLDEKVLMLLECFKPIKSNLPYSQFRNGVFLWIGLKL